MLELLGLLLLSGLKFFFAPGSVIYAGYDFWEAILITVSGGWAGVLFFYYFGGWFTGEVLHYFRKKFLTPKSEASVKIMTRKKRMNWRIRFLARVRRDYGLIGLSFITPVLISIPLGSILISRYYRHDKRTLPFLFLSVFIWSVVLTSVAVCLMEK